MANARKLAHDGARRIRNQHQPADGSNDCRTCGQHYPCDVSWHADDALDRLEALQVSAVAVVAE